MIYRDMEKNIRMTVAYDQRLDMTTLSQDSAYNILVRSHLQWPGDNGHLLV